MSSPAEIIDLTQPMVPPAAAVPIPKVSQYIDLTAEDEDAVSEDEDCDDVPNEMDLDFIDDRPLSELELEPNGRMKSYADGSNHWAPECLYFDSQGSEFVCTCEGWNDGQHTKWCPEYQLWANMESSDSE